MQCLQFDQYIEPNVALYKTLLHNIVVVAGSEFTSILDTLLWKILAYSASCLGIVEQKQSDTATLVSISCFYILYFLDNVTTIVCCGMNVRVPNMELGK